jgi:hypothetical protein
MTPRESPEQHPLIPVLSQKVPCLSEARAEVGTRRQRRGLPQNIEDQLDQLDVGDGLLRHDEQRVKVCVMETEVSGLAQPRLRLPTLELPKCSPAERLSITDGALQRVPNRARRRRRQRVHERRPLRILATSAHCDTATMIDTIEQATATPVSAIMRRVSRSMVAVMTSIRIDESFMRRRCSSS